MRKSQQGYFLVVAVILILLMGAIGSLIAYLVAGSARIAPAELQGLRAYYLAESGLEIAARSLVGSGTGTPLTCATLTGAAAVTNASLLDGTFTATAVNNALYTGSSTLSGGISASASSLTLASSSGFAAHGRVRIGSEAIDYASISGNTLLGLRRGVAGTTASSHSSGASVSQSMCLVDVQAGIPSVASPTYRRELQMAVEIITTTSDAWLVGNRRGNDFTFARWNNPTAGIWNDYSFSDSTNREHLYGVSMVSDVYGWAVGRERSNDFTMLYWNGTSWTVTNKTSCNNQHLYGIDMVSTSEGWAVGVRYRPGCGGGQRRYDIMKWDGATWTLLAPPDIPADSNSNQNLNAVSMKDTSGNGLADIGFAVGNSGQILQYDGSTGTWTADTSPTTRTLRGVYTVSSGEAWAVGNNGTILKWSGLVWATVSSPTSRTLRSIAMVDSSGNGQANYGYAVGNSGDILYYDGSTWTLQQSIGSTLYGVSIGAADDVWTVGGSDTIRHWDGASWTQVTSPISGNPTLYSVNVVSTGTSTTGTQVGSWQQVFR